MNKYEIPYWDVILNLVLSAESYGRKFYECLCEGFDITKDEENVNSQAFIHLLNTHFRIYFMKLSPRHFYHPFVHVIQHTPNVRSKRKFISEFIQIIVMIPISFSFTPLPRTLH